MKRVFFLLMILEITALNASGTIIFNISSPSDGLVRIGDEIFKNEELVRVGSFDRDNSGAYNITINNLILPQTHHIRKEM